MKIVIISLVLYAVMKYIYAPWGDYYSDYWSVAYFIVNYVLMTAVIIYFYLHSESTAQGWFFMLFLVHSVVLLLFYILCLFSESYLVEIVVGGTIIEGLPLIIIQDGIIRDEIRLNLYRKAIPDKAYFNLSTIPLTIGILYIQYKLRKSHAGKSKRMDKPYP